MIRLVRVKFANGKTAEFDAEAFSLEAGDSVLVDTEKGVGLGKVTSSPYEKERRLILRTPRKVVRKATSEDLTNMKRTNNSRKTPSSSASER